VRRIARLSARIQTKLLIALGVLAALLIALGVIALVVLGQANTRAERLVDLQHRTRTFNDLRLATTSQLLALAKALATPEALVIDDATRKIVNTSYRMDAVRFAETDETELVGRVAGAQAEFAAATTRTLALLSADPTADVRGQAVEVTRLADQLTRLNDELVNRAEAEVAQGVSDTRDTYARSQLVVVAFGGASLMLALVLGLATALSIIGPLRAIGARVGRIAEGDFTGQLRVENRDELGTLAANVDRMGDQLAVLYEQQGMRAADEERLRLARDLHDLLGNSLSLITIKSQLARRLLPPGDASLVANEIADIERVARESLQDVRHAVDGYRQPSLSSALAGARAALAAAGIDSTIDVTAESLPTAVDATLAWAVREGVTNVIRHSKAAACSIRLTRESREASLEITDNGAQAGSTAPGNGLRGLQERAAARGGHADAGPLPDGGFRVTVSVPL
jgi:signal transduction histidine kinase